MERFYNAPCDPDSLSPLTLAFVGDSVYGLFVREQLVCEANRSVKALHRESVKSVCCQAQSACMEKLLPVLTEQEQAVFRRGRNASPSHSPKSASSHDYHYATGLETLFGYLYVKGDIPRLEELFDVIERGYEEASA